MTLTRSKKSKRLLRWLSVLQNEDQILGPSTTLLIKHSLLHNHHRCIQVTIRLAGTVTMLNLLNHRWPYSKLPNFLQSQLDAQKIADGSRLWTQIAPILTFIRANIGPIGSSRGYPTLFLWYSTENHRSYLFFAFLRTKMAPVTYSAQDLIRMKTVPTKKEVYEDICQKLQKDLTIEDILRFPVNRSLPLITEEEIENAPTVPSNTSVPVQQLDGTDSEWRYRGRTENESGEAQPISAPPGLVAQKDEGFQRFYKAVVSPTHVRVTAGGRIVPNTRVSSSPTGKWSKEKPSASGFFASRPSERDMSESTTASGFQPPFAAFPSLYPGYAPAMQGSAYPMFPWHMYNAFCLPAAMAPATNAKSNDKDTSRHQQDGVDDRQDRIERPALLSPNQGDQGRPVYFNGQWPMPPNPPFFAYGMPALSGFPHPSMIGSVAVQASLSATAAAPIPVSSKPDKTTEAAKRSPPATASPAAQTTTSLTNPPISSIRPSEITKKQIDVLRGSLKYLEDQLLYNKHQIDEKWMEYQAHMVRQQVQQFERNLENQKAFKESHYPKVKEKSSSSSASLAAQNTSIDGSAVQKGTTSAHDSATSSGQKTWRDKDRDHSQFSQGINSTKSVNLFAPKKISNASLMSNELSTEPAKKASKLPVNAALAPPFQPQNEGVERPSLLESRKVQIPYLVGMLPTGVNPDKAQEAGYQYARDLTDDELRARHMYWGKAPHHLQRGLPKFDGKDFYPPSPTRDRSSESNDSLMDIRTESGGARSTAGSVYDPFRSLGRPRQRLPRNSLGHTTQSETLHKSEARNSSLGSSIVERGTTCTGKISRNYEQFLKIMDASSNVGTVSSKVNSDSEDGGDGQSILFKGRKPTTAGTKSRNEIWQSMLNKGKSSGQVIPSTISSATAQGVLPQYRGHATAYLAPTIANATLPAKASTINGKPVENGDLSAIKSQEAVQAENMPPTTASDNDSIRPASLHQYNPQGILSQ